MLQFLVGNKSVERILLALLVNEKSYATELHKWLETPLNPIQKALSRLEKGGILTSYFEGKTRIYHFNPSFPLLQELEALLKKAYSLASPLEKKRYFFLKDQKWGKRNPETKATVFEKDRSLVLNLFSQMKKIVNVAFSAKAKSFSETDWNGVGRGDVKVVEENSHTLIFQETGSWSSENGKNFNYTNTFRWKLDEAASLISLEHLRFGPQKPVFLFHLVPVVKGHLEALSPHLCEADSYFGQLKCEDHFIHLHWRIIGPKKNEEISYLYS